MTNISKNKFVKIFFKNGVIIEGFINKWDEENNIYEVIAMENKSIFFIHSIDEVMFIQMSLVQEERKQNFDYNNINYNNIPHQNNIESKNKVVTSKIDDDLSKKSLAELRIEAIKKEKDIIANKVRNHIASDVQKVNYERPGFFKK